MTESGHATATRRSPRYPPDERYKDSGVDWIGKVPRSWDVARLKFVARLESGHTPSRSREEYWQDCTIPWFTLSDVWQIRDGREKYLGPTKERVSELGLANSAARLLPAGTVILSRTASVGFSGIMPRPMATTQDFVNWVPGPLLESQYLLYVLRGMRQELRRLAMGSTHQTIYMPDVHRFRTPLPPLLEQRSIVAFLDRETARIDALIDRKQRLIELLEEKRTALITRAVTKGLDPDVEMKESGVEWLGEIPAHWETSQLKHLASLQAGLTLGREYDGHLVTRPYLRVANVQAGRLDLRNVSEIEVPPSVARRHELESGDVLMTEGGDFDKLGRGCVWSGEIPGCLHQNHIFAVRTRPEMLSPSFLAALTESGYGRTYFTATSKQSTNLASTNSTKVLAFPVPLPSLNEQREILAALRSGAAQVGGVVGRTQRGIELLREYRQALISAAVTGKIDVREAA